MSNPIVYVGTEPRMWLAFEVLKYTIEKNASTPVTVIPMDYSTGGIWEGWNIGREHGIPATRGFDDIGNAVWFTDFTNFRWAIPEANEFKGRAIYIDVDQIILGDINELFNLDMQGKNILTINPNETSVMLFDCGGFDGFTFWPTIAEMKANGLGIVQYIRALHDRGFFGDLTPTWNCLDGRGYNQAETKLIHYTNMASQPWRPYPERLQYYSSNTAMEQLWFTEFYEMLDNGLIDTERLKLETAFMDFEKEVCDRYRPNET